MGLRQADFLARQLQQDDLGNNVVVLSSPARRAVQTAEIMATAFGVPVAATTCALCEMHPGAAEGLTYAQMAERFGPHYGWVPGAEYFPDWVPTAVEALRALAAHHRGKTLVAVTHFAVVRASFAAFSAVPENALPEVHPPNGSITEWQQPVTDNGRAPRWVLVRSPPVAGR